MENREKEIIEILDRFLNEKFPQDAPNLWENFYIKKQIEKRVNYKFKLNDHIRAMVYSMLSAQTKWSKIEKKLKKEIDPIFKGYDAEYLKYSSPCELRDKLKVFRCGSISTLKQMQALKPNIETFEKIEAEHGNIDDFYAQIIENNSYEKLISLLAYPGKYKLRQMGVPLVSEYLRNMGHDIPKPDRHTRRILGSSILNAEKSYKGDVKIFDVFKIIKDYSEKTGESQAKIDYLLWAYCGTATAGFAQSSLLNAMNVK